MSSLRSKQIVRRYILNLATFAACFGGGFYAGSANLKHIPAGEVLGENIRAPKVISRVSSIEVTGVGIASDSGTHELLITMRNRRGAQPISGYSVEWGDLRGGGAVTREPLLSEHSEYSHQPGQVFTMRIPLSNLSGEEEIMVTHVVFRNGETEGRRIFGQ